MMLDIILAVLISIAVVYYVRDISNNLLKRYFELKDEVGSLEERFNKITTEINRELRKVEQETQSRSTGRERILTEKLNSLEQQVKSLEKALANIKNIETKFEYRLGELSTAISKIQERIATTEKTLSDIKVEIKGELREEILHELQEEIEHLEETIERRKDQEVAEFLELIKATITLQPEKLRDGLIEVKKGLLSMRDVAKVYVMTEKGVEEFYDLKKSLIDLLKNLRKLAIVSVPDDSMYSLFNEAIVNVKRLNLPMTAPSNEDGENKKRLNPEKSFIQIHKIIYRTIETIEKISEMIDAPIPVTPVEKEFYEKLRLQFEELQRLEQQVNELLLKLSPPTREAKEKSLKEILEDLL